ncbi:LacI family DNA-binding transcriptional regulator [Kiritimatiella glycovorans]|uniref:LacI family transcriptional regulator n=1 Tax=Kiritimatiella glycovorans TaxID=1307763 RepID=A0A0G3EHI5_9BACT|nr:LacI family DNA-binding transcriptional regulator [Kiritimatiella glycovorans]AKJ63644.1 LacI family transcriptional regulator [Kiritimatiella glycovorans]
MPKVTLYDIARICGVNASTVSRALRNDARLKTETIERIQSVAEKKGYRPNLAARYLKRGKAEIIWFIVPTLGASVDWKSAEFATQHAHDKGYDLAITVHHGDQKVFDRAAERMMQGLSAGAIINRRDIRDLSALDPLRKRNFPIIFIDVPPERSYGEGLVVTTDNEAAGRELVRRCIDAGARQFMLLFRRGVNAVERERFTGAARELRERGVTWVNGITKGDGLDWEALDERVALLGSSQEAVLTFAIPHADALRRKHCTIGCFDDWLGEARPAERVIVAEQDYETIADTAVDRLANLIDQTDGSDHPLARIPVSDYLTRKSYF